MNLKNIKIEIKKAKNIRDLDEVFQKYLGKKGEITRIFDSLKKFSKEKKRKIGRQANLLKNEFKEQIKEKLEKIKKEERELKLKKEKIDVSRPGKKMESGHLHPLTFVSRELCHIFESIGFSVVEGPEVESSWYHFDALNIKKDHPTRDPWQTFNLKINDDKKLLLRAHTSPVQIRFMEKHFPPFRIVVPGKVFRPEATDATHEMQFYQLEGLMIGKDVSVSNFKAIIEEVLNEFFKRKTEIRLRPSFFPFTEPSFEIDLKWKKGQWLEIMGAGMVHPNVLKNSGINPKEWQGFAFGLSIDRLTMMKYKIIDIRLFHSNDLRFLKQF